MAIAVLPPPIPISNNLTTSFTGTALSAAQGKILNESAVHLDVDNEMINGVKTFNQRIRVSSDTNSNRRIVFYNTDTGNGSRVGQIALVSKTDDETINQSKFILGQFSGRTTPSAYNTGYGIAFHFPYCQTNMTASVTYDILTTNSAWHKGMVTTTTFSNSGLTFTAWKYGNFCQLNCNGSMSTERSTNHTFGRLPVGYRPKTWFRIAAKNKTSDEIDTFQINSNGYIVNKNTCGNGQTEVFSTMYFTQP